MTRGKRKKELLLNFFHSFKPGNLIVGSHCSCPTEESDCLQRENLSCLGCFDGFCSVAKLCSTLCNPMDCSTPDFPILHHLQSMLKLISIESVVPFNHLVFYFPLLLLPSIFFFFFPASQSFLMSQHCIKWPKYWSFTFSNQSLKLNTQG